MKKTPPLHLPFNHYPAVTLSGILKQYSTEELHTHDSHQILHCTQGISLLLDGRCRQPLFNAMTAFIPAGCPHRSVVPGREVHYTSLYIDRSLFRCCPDSIRIFDISELGAALLRKIDLPYISGSDDGNGNLLSDLQQDCLNLFLKILQEDIRNTSALARLPVPTLEQNSDIIRYLEARYREKVTLQHIGSLLPYTSRHISRLFKEDLHISIFEYLKIYRILQASIMLETTDLTVTEIGFACGYNAISTFFKDFGQLFSVTPKQFRNRSLEK